MTPDDPFSSENHATFDFGELATASQQKQLRRGQRGGDKHRNPVAKPRPEEKSALVIWAYVEYQRLRQEGKAPDIHQWCAFFPTCRSALRRVLDVEAYTAAYLDHRYPNSSDESIDWPIEGSQCADFTIIRELARGSFARIYLATEASTGDRLVVLKCSLHGDAEARTMGRLTHPNIVPVLSARIDDKSGLTMVCMPYLGSATLEDVLDRFGAAEGSPPRKASFLLDVIRFRAQAEDPPQPSVDPCLLHGSYTDGVIRLAVQLAETLAFLHQHGVCHRDLKPSNVLLDAAGKPLLLDFNLSQSEREDTVPMGGTLRYMAPEQIRAFLDRRRDGMDERVDLYSLGVMVYELLGGIHPCASLLAESFQPSQAESMLMDLKSGFRPFREICPELERPVAAALDRCLALDASDRPGSATELAAALRGQFAPARRLRRWLAAQRTALLATLSLLLVVIAVLAYSWAVTPPYSEREYDRGRIAYRDGDFDRAEMHFDRALRAEPNNACFRYARGCARLQRSKYLPKAWVLLDEIRDDLTSDEQGAADPRSLAVNAYIRVRNQNYREAIQIYDQIRSSGYRPIMVLNNRAHCYFSIGRLKEAGHDLDEAAQFDPRCQAVHYNRALIGMQMRLQRNTRTISPQALEDMDQALQSSPKTPALYRDAAILFALAAEDGSQRPHFERALSYLRQAISTGEPPSKFNSIALLREALKHPQLADLLGSHLPQASPQPDLRLIDPVDLFD